MNVESRAFTPIGSESLAWLGTDPIPAKRYYDPAYFDAEREAIFRRTWLQIGHMSELPEPGSFIVREIEVCNASILIVRGRDDVLRAFHNVCTHRGTQLVSEQQGTGSSFSCRYHRWTFGQEGELRAAPDFERFFVDKESCALKKVAVDSCARLIFVNLDPEPEHGLREFLGDIAEQLEQQPVAKATTFSEYVYEIDGNWKLTYDNFQENYHIRFIHPKSIGTASTGPENPFGYATEFEFLGKHRKQHLWTNPAHEVDAVQAAAMGAQVGYAIDDGFGELVADSAYFALFPNFFLLGSPVLPFSHTVYPIAADKSRGVIRLYWNGEDRNATQRFAREFGMAAARDIHAEDRAVIEGGQRGLSSGALTHINFQAQEALCRHFINVVDEMVQAYLAEGHAR